MFSLGFSLTSTTALGRASFSPLALFTAGEQGFIYDPSDFSTLYQDPAGTTPVTAAGQTVGLMLDKSMGLVLGPELVTNGDFTTDLTGWTGGNGAVLSLASGGMKVTNGLTAFGRAVLSATTVPGRWYEVSFTVVETSGTGVAPRDGGGLPVGSYITSVGSYSYKFLNNGTVFDFQNGTSTPGAYSVIDEITLRELPGNHATQSVLASRPILAREPLGGRRNLLTYSEQFDNAAWAKNAATVTANAAVAPDGTFTADTLIDDGASARHSINQNPTITASATHTASVYVKAGTGRYFTLSVSSAAAGSVYYAARYDLQTATVTATGTGGGGGGTHTASSITSVGNGWYRCVLTGVLSTFTDAVVMASGAANSTGFGDRGAEIYTGTGSTWFLWGAQLELGSTATPYQRVVSTSDVTEAGKPDLWYLLFDGSDDFLVTNTITPGTDKAQVFAGVRKLSDAARAALVDFGGGGNGFFNIEAPSNASNPDYAFRSTGTLAVNTNFANYPAPITNIVTGLGDISGDRATLRVNGAQVGQSTGDQGTGNYLAYPAYIGRRGGTSLPFNGRLYGLIARFGPNLSDVQIAQTEQWMNSKTGAY